MSKVLGVSMFKDELDMVDRTVSNMCQHCDFVLIADNMSTDGTLELLRELEYVYPNLMVKEDREVGYYQSQKMTELARFAASNWGEGDDWIVPFDADELWFRLSALRTDKYAKVRAVWVPGTDFRPTTLEITDPVADMVYHEQPGVGFEPKIAFRWEEGAVIQQGNHNVSTTGHRIITDVMKIAHYPVRSFGQFKKKARNGAAAYAATTLDPNMGNHWRRWGDMSDEELLDEYNTKFFVVDAHKTLMCHPFSAWV